MTAHQQTKLNELAREFQSTGVREDSHSRSIYIDCYEHGLPENCVQCGREAEEHVRAEVGVRALVPGHYFKVAHPAATFRVSPSGFCQNLTPVAA